MTAGARIRQDQKGLVLSLLGSRISTGSGPGGSGGLLSYGTAQVVTSCVVGGWRTATAGAGAWNGVVEPKLLAGPTRAYWL